MASEELLARPEMSFLPGIVDEKSLVEMSGSDWRDQRRIALQILRDVGFGKSKMEEAVDEEIGRFIGVLDQNVGKPCDFVSILYPSVSNNVSLLIFGHGFSYTDPEKLSLDKNLDDFTRSFQLAGTGIFMPTLAKILNRLGFINYDQIIAQMMVLERYSQKEITSHRSGKKEGGMEDYIDGYLKECEHRMARKMNLETFNDVTLRRNITEFFAAGSDTIRTTLIWIMLFLVKHPEFQDRIRQEIDSVIGSNRRPSFFQDRLLLPFTMAFIYEVQRVASIVATNLLRRASSEVKLGPYTLPEDTIVIFNLYAVHHDPKLWNEPEKFDPSRFLIDNETKAVRYPYHGPLSGGKRKCPAEGLAYLEMFLYTTNIIQRYRIRSTDKDVNTEAGFGMTRYPAKMPLLIFERIN